MQKEGIKTIHVVCPSVWAWRPGRVKHFKHVDYMLCLFPFELEYCVNVRKQAFCIGHPLIDDPVQYTTAGTAATTAMRCKART